VLERVAHPKALALVTGAGEAGLKALHAAGAAAHPGVDLEPAAFVRQLGRMLRAKGNAYALETLNAPDLYLCAACLEAQPRALTAFEKGPLARALHALKQSQREEVRQLVLEKLLLGPKPRLLEYSGQGALQVWLSLVVRRAAINAGRGDKRYVAVGGAEEAEPEPAAALLASSPELQLGKKAAQAQVIRALKGAFAQLEPGERELLELFHLKGLAHEQIGQKLGAPRSTVAFWLTRARQKLLQGTRRRLVDALKLSDTELESLVREMGSRMELSLQLAAVTPRSASRSG